MCLRNSDVSSTLWTVVLLTAVVMSLLVSGDAAAQQGPSVPENVAVRAVDIWSDGTRMAGDLYSPKAMAASDSLPVIVMSHGWGGTKSLLVSYAGRFASEGYIVLAFDYRGWGDSDGRLVAKGAIPEPDENGEVTMKVQVIRTVVDPFDQLADIQRAIDFIQGEPNADVNRIGYWGSSYSGGHAVWLAANEDRVKCVVGQVSAADSLDIARTVWKDPDIAEVARKRGIDRARGKIEPVPQGVDKAPGLNGWPILEKLVKYRPVEHADRITIPILLIDAEKEQLFDRHKAGELAIQRAKANGARTKYHVVPGITHYGIYRGEPAREATALALDWFNEHLKGSK